MGCQRQFQQSVKPVALIVGSRQILYLGTQGGLRSQLIFTVGNEDVAADHAAFAFDNGFVVTLVHVHQRQTEVLGPATCQLDVDVLIERLTLPTDMREIHLDIHAILATQRGLTFEVVAGLCLPSPLAARQLRGVGIEGRQRVGVVLRERWQVVDERRGAYH